MGLVVVEDGLVSAPMAVAACTAMAVGYVAILYFPTMVLRLPPPTSLHSFMIRRFVCAFVSSIASVIACSVLLGVRNFREVSSIFAIYGIRGDHMSRAVTLPLFLTFLLYIGSFVSKFLFLASAWKADKVCSHGEVCLYKLVNPSIPKFLDWTRTVVSSVLAWRNYVVAPFTEELVFRACMIPLLLCAGFKTYHIIFFSPVFFSLAHLNHFLELYFQQSYTFLKAILIVGLQLGYTVIFGWYASFLFIRTGNLISPIVAHIFCNTMGLPIIFSSQGKGTTTILFAAGTVIFFWLLFPATVPDLYNDRTDNCSCWHGYCSWG